MSAAKEQMTATLGERAWAELSSLEALHREIQRNHERVLRDLDSATDSEDRSALQSAWNQYRAVVAELGSVTSEMESLRLTLR